MPVSHPRIVPEDRGPLPYQTTPENDRIRIASMKKLGRTMPCKCPICHKRIINIHGEQMWRYPDQTLLHKRCWREVLKTLSKKGT